MNISFVREVFRLREKPSSEVELSQLLLCNRYVEASNPWDRVFGLLGLLSDKKSLGLVPDYEQPLRDVYAHATYAGMVEQGVLYLLSLAIGNKSSLAVDEDWPSWVPRYHQLKGHREIALLSRAHGCRASEGASMSCSYSHEDNVLSVKGVLAGRVACVLDVSSLGDDTDHGADDDSDSEADEEEEKAVYQRLAQAWFSGPSLASANTSVSLSSIAASLNRQKDSTLKLWRRNLKIKDFALFFSNVARQSPGICDTVTERLQSIAGGNGDDSWSIGKIVRKLQQQRRLEAETRTFQVT
ncbi:hypothetical protein PRZ48_002213 [Zasmidium cellare]|uniref:Uncharacterized protein n=1 Tax=Zasmidium cellare TaxID=395010 RepID=A0ABR0F3E5_ZASCE|nr:hypothetical protein PRZ48_002213 [Zasmidium cellare]